MAGEGLPAVCSTAGPKHLVFSLQSDPALEDRARRAQSPADAMPPNTLASGMDFNMDSEDSQAFKQSTLQELGFMPHEVILYLPSSVIMN